VVQVAKRWQEYLRQFGPLGLVKHLIAKVVRPVWESTAVTLLVLQPPAVPVSAKLPIQIAILTPELAIQKGIILSDWENRWSRGEVCYAAWLNGRCIHYSWLSTSDTCIGEIHQTLRIDIGNLYIYDCFTDGEVRGNRIFPAVLSVVAAESFANGISTIWIAVEDTNRSSIHGIERAGFAVAGEIRYRRMGPWSRVVAIETQGVSLPQFSQRK
jgi:hypothetical protein